MLPNISCCSRSPVLGLLWLRNRNFHGNEEEGERELGFYPWMLFYSSTAREISGKYQSKDDT